MYFYYLPIVATGILTHQFTENALATVTALNVAWWLYLELKIGQIMFRPDSNHTLRFSPDGVLSMYLWPFDHPYAWHPQNWDLNIYAAIAGTAAISGFNSLYR